MQQQRFLTKVFNYRMLATLLTIASIVGMSFAYYLQKVVGLDPCPLCIFQRVGLIGMGIFAFLATVFNPKKPSLRLGFMLLCLISILWSVGVAGRHVWLQSLPPDEVPACGPGLNYWMDTLPIAQVFKEVFTGSGECAVIDWTLLGFSLPQLSLSFFMALTLVILLNCYYTLQKITLQ